MNVENAPVVFLSHASEDKQRFVEDFARRLRERGVDVWLDKWEMLPGDSLVDKIFEEGISNAVAMIVVLSKNSVEKPWVREELNAAFIKRIEGKCKLIPVVIEECAIPEVLRSTLWQSIPNLVNYDSELSRIVNAIFGISDKPAIGASPLHTKQIQVRIGDLTIQDSMILKIAGDQYLATSKYLINPKDIYQAAHELGLSEDEAYESFEVLDNRGLLKLIGAIGTRVIMVNVLPYGFQIYATECISDYNRIYRDVAIQIVNFNRQDVSEIAEALKQNEVVVNEIVWDLAGRGLIKIPNNASRDHMFIIRFSAELKRSLQ